MRVGLSLLCKNEADVIRPWLAYHLNRRFDEIVITDNVSSDGTWEILLGLLPSVILRQEPAQTYSQADWVYKMDCELRNRGCDWVVNLDVDEILAGDVRAACAMADNAGVEQIYPRGTFMRATHDDPEIDDPIKRITWHDPWVLGYTNDKAILHTRGLTGVCQGNHWGFWDHDIISTPAPGLYLYHYEQRSPEQLIKKYSGYCSEKKLANMGVGWQAMNKLWRDGGNEALINYWREKCLYDSKNLEQSLTI